MDFETIIGLEVHCQLNTKTKIFCSCATSFGDAPNTHVCPTCLALPGALPVLNKEAVKKAVSFGRAINARVNRRSVFDRKNYFYPDLPKAYQISQFSYPIVEAGELFIALGDGAGGKNGAKNPAQNGANSNLNAAATAATAKTKRIGITRAHLEEDAGKNSHGAAASFVDLNRAGTPLLEIVSEPDLRGADEAVAYLKKLHGILRFLNISDANMQEGSFRCDVNISIRPRGDERLYTRVEIKNLNSFRFIQKAIEFEENRQRTAWEDGTYEREVVQETRLFDTTRLVTKPMRSKEDSAEYRYFPDPDLLPVELTDELLAEVGALPELPDQKRVRYERELGLKPQDAELLTGDYELAVFFEELVARGCAAKNACSWLLVELLGRLKGGVGLGQSPVGAARLAEIIGAIERGDVSNKAAKDVLDYFMGQDEGGVENAGAGVAGGVDFEGAGGANSNLDGESGESGGDLGDFDGGFGAGFGGDLDENGADFDENFGENFGTGGDSASERGAFSPLIRAQLALAKTRAHLTTSEVIDRLGLRQVNDDSAVIAAAQKIIADNAAKVAEFKAGKDKLFGFFVGQVMKAGKGAFNPAKVNEVLKSLLG